MDSIETDVDYLDNWISSRCRVIRRDINKCWTMLRGITGEEQRVNVNNTVIQFTVIFLIFEKFFKNFFRIIKTMNFLKSFGSLKLSSSIITILGCRSVFSSLIALVIELIFRTMGKRFTQVETDVD